MVGISTGTPDVKNYVLLKGHTQVAFINPVSGLPYGWREVGNSCQFSLSMSTTTEKHYQCLDRVRTADLEYITELDATMSLRADEWMFENLALFTVGEQNVFQPSMTVAIGASVNGFVFSNPSANSDLAAPDPRAGGKWYDLGVSSTGKLIAGNHSQLNHANRIYNVVAADIQIDVAGTIYTGVPLGTTPGALEFVLNEDFGTFYIVQGSALAVAMNNAGIAAGATARTAALDLNAVAVFNPASLPQVQAITSGQQSVAVRIVGVNAANGTEEELIEIVMHQVILRPTGDLPLISETELARFTLEGTLQANRQADPLGAGYFTIRKV